MATKILVIEDDDVAAAFAQTALQGAGYDVIIAVDGQAGLDIAAKDGGIALIVLDIGLPGITGYEVSARIRTDPNLVDMPILMLTAKSSQQDKFLRAGDCRGERVSDENRPILPSSWRR